MPRNSKPLATHGVNPGACISLLDAPDAETASKPCENLINLAGPLRYHPYAKPPLHGKDGSTFHFRDQLQQRQEPRPTCGDPNLRNDPGRSLARAVQPPRYYFALNAGGSSVVDPLVSLLSLRKALLLPYYWLLLFAFLT
jgi:hypothetical protein